MDQTNKTQQEYDLFLLNLIPMLNQMESKSGGEGTAYFFGDYVIKEYSMSFNDDPDFQIVFPQYCKELQEYANKGYSIAKIYSWLSLPEDSEFRYFILEERAKGRELFAYSFAEFYRYYKNHLTKSEYNNILQNPTKHIAQIKDIAKEYIQDFIFVNEFIEALPEPVLIKFITESYDMTINAKYSIADLNAVNVFADFEGQKLTLIDNYVTDKLNDVSQTKEDYVSMFFKSLIMLFLRNDSVKNIKKEKLKGLSSEQTLELDPMIMANEKVNKAALLRLVRLANKYCDSPKINSQTTYDEIYQDVLSFLDRESAKEVMKEVGTTFEK